MDISALQRSVSASDVPLERLADAKNLSKDDKIAEVSRQFEAVLLRQILNQAQKPLFKSNLFPSGGTTNAIYQDMITQQLAERISEGGTFGFAGVLEKQLTAEYGAKKVEAKTEAEANIAAEEQIKKYKSPAIQPGKRI